MKKNDIIYKMNKSLDTEKAQSYKSNSQRARILTESWVLREIYCPSCGKSILDYENNKPVADFFCGKCSEDFELKSKSTKIGNKVSAGAYSKMMERISSGKKPNFFFMGYKNKEWTVLDFFVVPKHFFVPEIIEKRKPLSDNAERAGWVGSNILFSMLPKSSQIFYIKDGKELNKNEVLKSWHKTVFLKQISNIESKGWILDIMNCIDFIGKSEFSLSDLYSFESDLSILHPKNRNIKAKIRQQLQILRDQGYLEFTAPGQYRLI